MTCFAFILGPESRGFRGEGQGEEEPPGAWEWEKLGVLEALAPGEKVRVGG